MNDLRDLLEGVRKQYGKLTPRLVVEAARPKDSPLHDRVFDKTPKEAAEAYYLERARDLIQSLRVRYNKPDGTRGSVRSYLSVERAEGHVFERVEDVVQDDFARRLILTNLERDWKALQRQYGDLEEFWALVLSDAIVNGKAA